MHRYICIDFYVCGYIYKISETEFRAHTQTQTNIATSFMIIWQSSGKRTNFSVSGTSLTGDPQGKTEQFPLTPFTNIGSKCVLVWTAQEMEV